MDVKLKSGHVRLVNVLLVILGCWVCGVQAQQLSNTSTVDALTALQSRNLLKQAELDGAVLDKKIRDAQAGVSDSGTATQPGLQGQVSPAVAAPSAGTAPVAAPLPVYRGIFGSNGVLVATFLYAGGGVVDAKQGDRIPGGYLVKSLGVDGVTICKGRKCSQVALSDQAPVDPSAVSQPMGNVPGPTFLPISGTAPVR